MISGNPKVGRPVLVFATIAVLVVILVFVFLFVFKPTPPSKKPPLHPALLVMQEEFAPGDETTAARRRPDAMPHTGIIGQLGATVSSENRRVVPAALWQFLAI